MTSYFAPAVLALILQHLAVTLVAMSLVRERTSGMIELFRIAPVSAAEVLAGKVLAFGLIGCAIAGLTVALLVLGLGVPWSGRWRSSRCAIGLLLLASLGLGLLIAVVSDSERQAVQLSLLVLLASVFFSGFVLPIDRVQRAGPGDRLRAARDARHPAAAGPDAARDDEPAWEVVALGVIAAGDARRWPGSCCGAG